MIFTEVSNGEACIAKEVDDHVVPVLEEVELTWPRRRLQPSRAESSHGTLDAGIALLELSFAVYAHRSNTTLIAYMLLDFREDH
jgi:hypothetical protein